MARTAGRSADETRRMILDAAARLIGRYGTAVPVAQIADAAQVSKGGLLYHFPSKEDLLTGLAAELMERFRRDVELVAAEEAEGTPGRLARAYIRVNFVHASDFSGLRDQIALAAHLMFEPAMQRITQEDAERWRQDLHADGLDPAIVRMIIAASDGSTSAPLWGAVLSEADRRALESDLIALTHRR